MEKKNKGLVVTIVILIIISLGLIGYICYDKFYLKDNNNNTDNKTTAEKDTTDLTKANLFNLDSIKCVSENNTCTKSLDVYYGGKNHNVKLTKKLVDKEKYGIDVYIDNEFVETLDGGKYFDWTYGNPLDPDKGDPKDLIDYLEGYLYIVDSKYLALVYRQEGAKIGWSLVYFNGNKKADQKKIIVGGFGSSFGVEDRDLSRIGSVSFSENAIIYWREYCGGKDIKPDSDDDEFSPHIVIEEHYVTFDGKKVKDVVNSYITNANGGGSSVCGLYDK